MIDTVMILGDSYIRSNVRAKARLEIRNGFTVAVQDYTNPVTRVSNGWAGVLINLGLSSKPPPARLGPGFAASPILQKCIAICSPPVDFQPAAPAAESGRVPSHASRRARASPRGPGLLASPIRIP